MYHSCVWYSYFISTNSNDLSSLYHSASQKTNEKEYGYELPKEIPWVCNIFRTQVILSIYPNTPWQILHKTFLPFRISVEFWLSVHEYIKSEAKLYKWITAKNFILLSHEISFSMLSSKIVRILIPFFASLSIKLCNSIKRN